MREQEPTSQRSAGSGPQPERRCRRSDGTSVRHARLPSVAFVVKAPVANHQQLRCSRVGPQRCSDARQRSGRGQCAEGKTVPEKCRWRLTLAGKSRHVPVFTPLLSIRAARGKIIQRSLSSYAKPAEKLRPEGCICGLLPEPSMSGRHTTRQYRAGNLTRPRQRL
jgi:hypothetical protein